MPKISKEEKKFLDNAKKNCVNIMDYTMERRL